MLYEKIKALILKHSQIIKYIISGGTAAAVNILFLYIFTDFFGIWYLYSGVISFIIAFGVSFLLQKFWTFQDKATHNVHKQATIYLIVSILNLVWNTFLLYIFVDVIHMWYLLAQICAGAIVALSSFFIYKKFIFKQI